MGEQDGKPKNNKLGGTNCMTFEEKRAMLIDLIDFFNCNEGNKLNKYLSGPFTNIMANRFKIKMILKDNNFEFEDLTIETKKEPKEVKKQSTSGK